MSDGTSQSLREWFVTIKSWSRDHEPGEADWKQYAVEAVDKEEAREKAVEEAKSGISRLIHTFDTEGWEIVEVVER